VIYIDIPKFLKDKNTVVQKIIIIIAIFLIFLVIAVISFILQENGGSLNFENANSDNFYGFEEDKTLENSNDIVNDESSQNNTNDNNSNTENNSTSEMQENIKIHIAGEVNFNGIISLKEGSRIDDAIEKAGRTY
jgi:hypothetical protein